MKKTLLSLIIVGMMIGCSKKDNLIPSVKESSNSVGINSVIDASNNRMRVKTENEIFKLGLLDLAKSALFKEIVLTRVQMNEDEQISFNTIKDVYANFNHNLKNEMEESLINNGGTISEKQRLNALLNKLENGNYCADLYIPFSDFFDDLNSEPLISSLDDVDYSNQGLNSINLENNNVFVDELTARNQPTWVIILRTCNTEPLAAPMWGRCYCTRSTETTVGRCRLSRKEREAGCGQSKCGTADFYGNCPDSPCPSC
jgi:hypothetical protein